MIENTTIAVFSTPKLRCAIFLMSLLHCLHILIQLFQISLIIPETLSGNFNYWTLIVMISVGKANSSVCEYSNIWMLLAIQNLNIFRKKFEYLIKVNWILAHFLLGLSILFDFTIPLFSLIFIENSIIR